jgi:hypothetical protein
VLMHSLCTYCEFVMHLMVFGKREMEEELVESYIYIYIYICGCAAVIHVKWESVEGYICMEERGCYYIRVGTISENTGNNFGIRT